MTAIPFFIPPVALRLPLATQTNSSVDWLARAIAIAGLSLAIINWFWDWYKYRDLKKERERDREERRQEREQERLRREQETTERLNATPAFRMDERGGWFYIKLYNPSHTLTVQVRSVQIYFKGNKPAQPNERVQPLMDAIAFHHPRMGDSEDLDIPPRRDEELVLSRYPRGIISMICELPPEDVWLSVTSPGREVCRVDGKRIIPILRSVIPFSPER